MPVSSFSNETTRKPLFDSLRGFAMILMAIFHFSFDLNRFGLLKADFNSSLFWITFRGVIMTSFLILVGISFVLSRATYQDRKFWIRFAKLGASAALVSIGTWIFFRESWIFFGVLHLIAFATLLAPLLIRIPVLVLPVGLAMIVLPEIYTAPWFHQPGWNLLGLSPWPMIAEDYSPLFPWLGVVLLGVFLGSTVGKWPSRVTTLEIPGLSKLGRHALIFYLIHQAVLFPLAWAISR